MRLGVVCYVVDNRDKVAYIELGDVVVDGLFSSIHTSVRLIRVCLCRLVVFRLVS